jgi:hypothetical protein
MRFAFLLTTLFLSAQGLPAAGGSSGNPMDFRRPQAEGSDELDAAPPGPHESSAGGPPGNAAGGPPAFSHAGGVKEICPGDPNEPKGHRHGQTLGLRCIEALDALSTGPRKAKSPNHQ